jgi:aldehyde:ferredoxin oxidoreductase
MANYICNAYGMDTISAGSIISFAMECYENGIITKADTDGIELNWGNHRALVAMVEKMVKREGFGDVLADGVKLAAERIGKGAEKVAGHQFAGMPSAAMYWMNSTPGRHTQAFGRPSFITHLNNAMGTCMIIFLWPAARGPYWQRMMAAVTGLDRSTEELLRAGERIGCMRHVFNLREGLNPLEHYIHPRIYGEPPQTDGPLAGVTMDIKEEACWHLGALDWDRVTTVPSRDKLLELGLDDIAEELWPPEKMPKMVTPG